MPPGKAYFTIYESGSILAGTRRWIQILEMLLVPLKTPAQIIVDGQLRKR